MNLSVIAIKYSTEINSLVVFFMLVRLSVLVLFLIGLIKEKKYIPSNWQTVVESIYLFIVGLVITIFYRNSFVSYTETGEFQNSSPVTKFSFLLLMMLFAYSLFSLAKFLKKNYLRIIKKVKLKYLVYIVGFVEVTGYSVACFVANQYFFSFFVYVVYIGFIFICELYGVFEKMNRNMNFVYLKETNWIAVVIDYFVILVAAINYVLIQNHFGFKFGITKAIVLGGFLAYFHLLYFWFLFCVAVISITNKFQAYYNNDAIYRGRIDYRLFVDKKKMDFQLQKRTMWAWTFIRTAVSEAASNQGWMGPAAVAGVIGVFEGIGAAADREKREKKDDTADSRDEKILEDAHEHGQYSNVLFPPRSSLPPASATDNIVNGFQIICEKGAEKSKKFAGKIEEILKDFPPNTGVE